MSVKTDSGKKLAGWRAVMPDGTKKVKALYKVENGVKSRLWRAELPVELHLRVQNGEGNNEAVFRRAEQTYTVPKGFTKARLESMEISKPLGEAKGYIWLNWVQKAAARTYYYGGGFGEELPQLPQEWKVKEGDIIHAALDGYTNVNVSSVKEQSTLDILLILS
jgi:hypothetical protein